MIYFDNAATTKNKPQEVIDALVYGLEHFGNASRGVHEAGLASDRVIYEARKKLVKLFNGSNPRQLVFTQNGTEALNIAILGLFEPGDRIISS